VSRPGKVSLKVPALLKGDLEDCLSDPESGVRRGS
jgi:hypothetical protein